MRILVARVAALLLSCSPALAASPQVDAAVKVFNSVGADAGKLKTFCAMSKVLEAGGDKVDPKVDAEVDGYIDQLGEDFEPAWEAGDGLVENSEDWLAYNDALDDLEDKCK